MEMIENSITLLAVIFAMLGCLFRYMNTPRRGYVVLCVYFLAHLLSDYYWTVYTLVMKNEPDISAFIAYFGWNLAYALMLYVTYKTVRPGAKGFFHPFMLIPVPLNIYQFILYVQFGGIFNNAWSGLLLTATAVICVQSIMYYRKHRSEGVHFPYFHTFILLHVTTSYAMWTVSCFDWPDAVIDPYSLFEILNCAVALGLPWAMGRDLATEGELPPEKNSEDIRFQVRMQAAVSVIVLGVCFGGYYLAVWMKRTIPGGTDDPGVYNIIAVTLFVLSLFLVILMLVVLYVVALRYRNTRDEVRNGVEARKNRSNLVTTLLITLALMIFSVVFNSRLYYNEASSRMYETGEDKAETAAAEFQNYLYLAESTLKVTADTVEIMISHGEDPEKIEKYLQEETEKQKSEFDENFTGLYAYVDGTYMDGLGWVPPEGYDPVTRTWYIGAVDAAGRVTMIPPYIDAQTGSAVITICKMLQADVSAKEHNVVALDVIVNHIQDVTSLIDVRGKGYAMVVSQDGMIVSHRDSARVGGNLKEEIGDELFEKLTVPGNHRIDTTINGEDSTVFTSSVMDQWYVMIVVGDEELFEDTRSQILVNVLVSFAIFALVSLFYFLGYKNEQAYSKKMEEMKVSRQKQEYEAKVLRLEKHAADEANRAKSNFLADMSHEIRTPINAILGMNEMIMRSSAETEVLDYAKHIKTSGDALLQLINSILDFSKIEDGKMEILPVRYKLSSLIAYLDDSIRERARSKGLEFNIRVLPTLPSELYGDDMRIEQVVINMLTNAVKYTQEGSVTLTFDERERREDKVLLYVEVKDTGIGIKEEDMERLFQSFERLDLVRNRSIEGTGLGISIITRLLDLMDSRLDVKSTYGEGSAFSFELWQKIENTEPVGDYREVLSGEDARSSYRESFTAPDARILIVDDTQMNLIVAVSLLKDTGIRIDTASGGVEAVRLADENRYDVILLDQRMPGMDGTETLAAIRSSENGMNTDTPVICLTADAIRGARERYLAEGFTDYITKPVEGRELERVLADNIPPEKMTVRETSSSSGRPQMGKDRKLLEALERSGFDTGRALAYCGGDIKIYKTVLSEFAREYGRKSDNLKLSYDRRSWHDFSVLIHSVKSTALTIGAPLLSEKAARLEKASDDEDDAAVKKDYFETMKLYEQVRDVIYANMEVSSEEDEDVLEFAPGSG